MALEEIDGIVLNKTVNKRKNLAFVLVLDKTSRFGLADWAAQYRGKLLTFVTSKTLNNMTRIVHSFDLANTKRNVSRFYSKQNREQRQKICNLQKEMFCVCHFEPDNM